MGQCQFIAPPSTLVGEEPGVRGFLRNTYASAFAYPLPNPSPQVGGAFRADTVAMTSQKAFPKTNARAKRLRREPTYAEKQMWKLLKQIPDAHFRRQVPVGNFVFDFASHKSKLIIEVDGGVHRLPDVQERDQRKTEFAEQNGYRIMRFTNDEVIGGPDSVFPKITEAVTAPHPFIPASTEDRE